MTKRRLGELLQAEGLLTEDQLKAALNEQRKNNLFLGEALVKLGFVSEEVIAQTIVQQFSLPFMLALNYTVVPEVLSIFPERMYYEYQFVAVDKIGKTLVIVGSGLMNHDVMDELERLSGCKVCQYVSTWKDIRATLDKYAKNLKKGQRELSDLGTLLLDATPAPAPIPHLPPPPAASAAAPASRPFVPVVTPTSPRPAPAPIAPGVVAAAASTQPAAARAPGPSTATTGIRPVPAGGSNAALKGVAGATTARLSAFSGPRPPGKTSNPGVLAVAGNPVASTPGGGPAPAPPPTATRGLSAFAGPRPPGKTSTPNLPAASAPAVSLAPASPPAPASGFAEAPGLPPPVRTAHTSAGPVLHAVAAGLPPPGKAPSPSVPAVPEAPEAPAAAAPGGNPAPASPPANNPPQPLGKTGLLGLFKNPKSEPKHQ